MHYTSIKDLHGKKLLILAGGPNLVTLVERAKELGIYTIVTDYYDMEESPAKRIADEYWDISWADIDALEKKCREEKVNGVTTGYSESPVGCCIQLCARLKLPCYCTEEQLALTRNKILFKKVCRKNGVPVVNEYPSIDSVTNYPIIVKPVDRAGSIGVGVATNFDELKTAYAYALEESYSKNVIIEDFITNGTKFDVYYAICAGEPILLSDDDTINAQDNGFERVVQSGWVYPSKYHKEFLLKADEPIKRMIKDLKIHDGYIFFSGFAIEKEGEVDFVFFETGFRLSGEHMHRYISALGIVNVLDIFIVHALTGSTELVEWRKEEDTGLKCVTVNYYAANGTVSSFEGTDSITKMKDCIFFIQYGKTGEKCDTEKAILSKMSMFHFCNHSPSALAHDVETANKTYEIKDESGHDMIYDRMNPMVIADWWNI